MSRPGGPTRRCCFLALISAVLAACSTFDVGPFLKEQITGDTWRACLAREYQAEARAQVRAGRDWREADLWAVKGREALEGPNQPGSCDCATAEARAEILATGSARADLQTKYEEAKTACAARAASAEARTR